MTVTGTSEMQHIPLEIFGHSIAVSFSDDIKHAMAVAHPESDRIHDAEAATYTYNSKAKTELFFPFDCDMGTVAHETFHAVWHVFEYHGLKRDNESMAYHLGHLVRKVLECKELALQGRREYEREKELEDARNKELADAGLLRSVLPSEPGTEVLAGTA